MAGKRAGLAGERSGLWHEFHRVIAELAPRWVLIENVPGLLSSNSGEDFAVIIEGLVDLGYGVAWRVLDAQYFGVPQRRRRVFIVGCLGDWAAPGQVLFEPESLSGDPPTRRAPGKDVAGTLGGCPPGGGWAPDTDRMTFVPTTAWALQERDGKGPDSDTKDGHLIVAPLGGGNYGQGTMDEGVPNMVFNPYRTLEQDGSITSGFAERPVVDALHSPTGNKEPLIAGSSVRRLTPTECERLQGFPDGWTSGQADSSRYRQLGNAIAVPVVGWIARRLLDRTPVRCDAL